MNSEEIKEIGRMFLSIQNNNGHGDADNIVAQVITALQEQLAFVDYQALEASEDMLGKKISAIAQATEAFSSEGKWPREVLDKIPAIEGRLNKAIDTSKNWRAEVNDKLKILDDKSAKYILIQLETLEDRVNNAIDTTDKELHKLRKDYRDLQDEMWDRFKLIEDWIKSDTSKEKDTLKAEIVENAESTLKKAAKRVLGSSATLPRNTPVEPKRYIQNQEARENWDNQDLDELDISVRSYNAIKNHGIRRVAQLLTYSPTDLIKIKSFGRKCLREVIDELKKRGHTLNMEKEKADRELRKARIIKQFKL
tara:strand:- start:1728 stop:2654 length:927 start_codon:yes stop_codon:yes gene_type:complete